MHDLADWEKTIAKSVEQSIKEAMVADGCDERMMTND